MRAFFTFIMLTAIVTAAHAQVDRPAAGSDLSAALSVPQTAGVPVFPNDIIDRPYTVVGEISAKVRKATILSNEASQDKIYRELWERARKLGADAVIKAKYGDSHVTAFSWGSTTATGTAIKFTAPAEAHTDAR